MDGQDKLLRQVDGLSQLRRSALFALSTGKRVIVTLPPDASDRTSSLDGLPITILKVPNHSEGMSASLHAARNEADAGEALMVLPGDMPEISPEALRRLLRRHDESPLGILRGSHGDELGHPVVIPADLVDGLSAVSGDVGARDLLDRNRARVRAVPLAGAAATLDLDTVANWTEWERSRQAIFARADPCYTAAAPLAAAARASGLAVLAIITDVHGASYRTVGAMMCLFPEADPVGTLTNGCIEADLAIHARAVLETRRPLYLRYCSGSPFFDIRLPCGGALEVALFPSPSQQTLDDVACLSRNRCEIALEFAADGSSTLQPSRRTGWDGDSFIINLQPDIRMMVFGEGTEAVVFSQIARGAGYDQILYSPSSLTVDIAKRVGCASQHWTSVDVDVLRSVDPWTAVVAFFHDHQAELPALAEALRSPAFYIGAQGSRRVAEQRKLALADMGVGADDVERLYSPIGLIHSARDPRTLAVSALADILRASGKGALSAELSLRQTVYRPSENLLMLQRRR